MPKFLREELSSISPIGACISWTSFEVAAPAVCSSCTMNAGAAFAFIRTQPTVAFRVLCVQLVTCDRRSARTRSRAGTRNRFHCPAGFRFSTKLAMCGLLFLDLCFSRVVRGKHQSLARLRERFVNHNPPSSLALSRLSPSRNARAMQRAGIGHSLVRTTSDVACPGRSYSVSLERHHNVGSYQDDPPPRKAYPIFSTAIQRPMARRWRRQIVCRATRRCCRENS